MYSLTLLVHSWLRWALVALGLLVVVRGFAGASSRRPFTPGDARTSLAFIIAIDLQLLVGAVLYGVLSPVTRIAFANMGAAMRARELRFWAVEHLTAVLLAVVFAHVGRVRMKRAADDRARHSRLATWTLLSLLAALAAIPWPMMAIGRPLFRLH